MRFTVRPEGALTLKHLAKHWELHMIGQNRRHRRETTLQRNIIQKIELIHGSCADQDVDIVVNAAKSRYMNEGCVSSLSK